MSTEGPGEGQQGAQPRGGATWEVGSGGLETSVNFRNQGWVWGRRSLTAEGHCGWGDMWVALRAVAESGGGRHCKWGS